MDDIPMPLPLPELLADWERFLKAANKRPRTIISYLQVMLAFNDWLDDQDLGDDAGDVVIEDIEDYLIEVRERTSAANEKKHYASMKQFWRWLTEVEKEIDASPMEGLPCPFVPEKPVPVIPDDQLVTLLRVCAGKSFDDRRDTAIVRLFVDTGLRVGELAGLTVDGVDQLGRPTGLDWRYNVAHVVGKGDRARPVPFGDKTTSALRSYLRRRAMHEHAKLPALFIGRFGGLTESGVFQMLERRCDEAGIPPINPHRFRHTFAHRWKRAGGAEYDLMLIMGWETAEMARRYGKSAAVESAAAAHKRLSLGDQI